jgi:hypothetical protein
MAKGTVERLIKVGGTAVLFMAAAGLLAARMDIRQTPLFVIERSANANVVHYDANIGANGELDPHQPITAYWVMAAIDGHREELTPLEKSRAYGFTVESSPDPNSYHLRLVAQRRRDIAVVRQGGEVRAETFIDGRHAHLQKLYVSTHKILAVPTVQYIELFGVDVATGERVSERVQP